MLGTESVQVVLHVCRFNIPSVYLPQFFSFCRCMNTSEVNFAHSMRMIAFLTNLNAVGMDQTGKFNSSLYALKLFLKWAT